MNKIELILNKAFNSDTPELQGFPISVYRQILHKYEDMDGNTFFKRLRSEDGGQYLDDSFGNFMYVRFNGPITVNLDRGKLVHTVPLRIVGGFMECKNTFEIAEAIINILYKYINKYLQEDIEIELNNQVIMELETNDMFKLKTDKLELFSIDFSIIAPFSNVCAVEDLVCDRCTTPEEETCIGFPTLVIPNPY